MVDSPTNSGTTPPDSPSPKPEIIALPPSSKFSVRLTMLSDWHIGTGAGRPGNIDHLIARDADGLPFVPAKTLNGIWRDALERLAFGLDGGIPGPWSRWTDAIFGNQPGQPDADPNIKPRASILSVQPARLSAAMRKLIDEKLTAIADKLEKKRQRRKLITALTFVKPGVAIDTKCGTAKPDFLRFEEMGRAGTTLEAEIKLAFPGNFDEVAQRTVLALLILSARLVERMGGKRRRGSGLCQMHIYDAAGNALDTDAAHAWLAENQIAATVPAPDDARETISLQRVAQDGGWQTLAFALRLRTPVSIVTATLGNIAESLDFIPGTYLLPQVTRVLRRKLGDGIFQAVAYGDVLVLPATIEINSKRGLPVPRVLAQRKVEGGFDKQGDNGKNTIYNKLLDDLTSAPQLKPLRSGYVQALASVAPATNVIGKLPSYKTTPKALLMHNTVEDEWQRPTEAVGVYSREAIAAGTTLRGEIRIRQSLVDQLGANWWMELACPVRLGTSRKDDYGLASLELLEDENRKAIGPQAFETTPALDVKQPERLTVCLLSDCLLRDANLRQTNQGTQLARQLGDKLEVTLSPVPLQEGEATALVMTRRIESWHEGWGLPRPTLVAMEAGSCIVFKIEGFDLSLKVSLEARMRELEAAGIGERRGEGYGQICFNPSLLTQAINNWQVAAKPSDADTPMITVTGELSREEREFAELIETAMWRDAMQLAALKVADDERCRRAIFGFEIENHQSEKSSVPPMSQIGSLRSAISRLQIDKDRELIDTWLEHLKATANRRDKWASSKEAAIKKLDAINKLIAESASVWESLGGHWREPLTLVRTANVMKETLWAETVRALLDACARAHKRDLEK